MRRLALLSALSLWHPVVLAAPPAPTTPLAAFVHEDQFYNPRMAPDGKHIAITARVPSGDRFIPVVMMYALPDMTVSGAIRLPVFEVPVDYRWVSNSRLVIAKGREFGSREAPQATGEIVATDLDGKKQEYLFGYKMRNASSRGSRYGDDDAFNYIEDTTKERDGRLFITSHAWEGNHSLLYEVDSMRATRTLLADLPMADLNFVLQHDGKPRFAIGTDDQSHAVEFRFDDAKKSWNRIELNVGRRYRPFYVSTDDRSFIASYSAEGEPDQLIREDLATGKRTTLFADAVSDAAGLLYNSASEPFAAHATVGIPQVRYFGESGTDTLLYQQLSAQFPGHYLHFIDFSDDGKLLLFSVKSDRDPGSYYLFNRTTMNASLLFSAMEAIDPEKMAERRPISLKARDGTALHGYLTMPTHAPQAKLPLVLLPHGGPHGIHDSWFFDDDAQFLASRGYAVLQVNYRGSGGRGVNFKEAGFREWGGKILNDLDDATRWAIAQGEVDGNRVCAYGASFGAYAALMLAARDAAMYKCAVGYAGVYDLKLLAKPENNRNDTFMTNTFRKYIGDDRAELDRISPINLAARITSPVLLVHGGNDKRAPVAHANTMRAALIAAGRPPEWLYAPNEGHGFYDTANRTAFYEQLGAFLDRHIGTPAAQ